MAEALAGCRESEAASRMNQGGSMQMIWGTKTEQARSMLGHTDGVDGRQ